MDINNVLADHGLGGGGSGLFTKMTPSLTAPSSPALWDLWLSTSTAIGKVSVQLTTPSSPAVGDLFICADPKQYGFALTSSAGNKYITASQDQTISPYNKVRIYYEGTFNFYIVFAKVQQWDGTKWAFIKTQYWNGSAWITIGTSSSNVHWVSMVGTTPLVRKIDPTGAIIATSVENFTGTSSLTNAIVCDASYVYGTKSGAYNYLDKLDASTLALISSTNILFNTSYICELASSTNFIYAVMHGSSGVIRQIAKSTLTLAQSTASSFTAYSIETDENEDIYITASGSYGARKFSHVDMSQLFYTTEDTVAVLGIAVGKTHIIEMKGVSVKKRDKYTGALVWGPIALSPTGFVTETPLVIDGNGDFYYTIGYVTYKNSGTTGLNIWSKTFKASVNVNDLATTPDGFLMVSMNDGTLIKANASDGSVSWTQNYSTPLIIHGYDMCIDSGKVGTNPNNW